MRNPFRKTDGMRLMMGEKLSRHTSFRIGGAAQYFAYVHTKKALRYVLRVIRDHGMQYFVIGAGTNLLVADKGFAGVILKLGGVFKRMSVRNGLCYCGSGVLVDDLLKTAAKRGYGGLEFMAGIPGTVGGAIKGNAGAFGSSISDFTDSIMVMDENGSERMKTKQELGFSYRESRIRNGDIITLIKLRMRKDNQKSIRLKIGRNLAIRKKKHPTGYSAGSFFKNPAGHAAGRLIEECGLKGLSIGGAEISEKHGNYIVNRGQASAADVIALARMVQQRVHKKTGVRLEREVRLLK
jgi:UDP-N-acetylmuramate dehydrogenase